jgi:hypothetical protein
MRIVPYLGGWSKKWCGCAGETKNFEGII